MHVMPLGEVVNGRSPFVGSDDLIGSFGGKSSLDRV
jgi:hypothetical protein